MTSPEMQIMNAEHLIKPREGSTLTLYLQLPIYTDWKSFQMMFLLI